MDKMFQCQKCRSRIAVLASPWCKPCIVEATPNNQYVYWQMLHTEKELKEMYEEQKVRQTPKYQAPVKNTKHQVIPCCICGLPQTVSNRYPEDKPYTCVWCGMERQLNWEKYREQTPV